MGRSEEEGGMGANTAMGGMGGMGRGQRGEEKDGPSPSVEGWLVPNLSSNAGKVSGPIVQLVYVTWLGDRVKSSSATTLLRLPKLIG